MYEYGVRFTGGSIKFPALRQLSSRTLNVSETATGLSVTFITAIAVSVRVKSVPTYVNVSTPTYVSLSGVYVNRPIESKEIVPSVVLSISREYKVSPSISISLPRTPMLSTLTLNTLPVSST